MNSHQEGAYASDGPFDLPESEAVRDNVILLPLFSSMTDAEQDQVIAAIEALNVVAA
jgi:perosamine synthetase